MGKNWWESKLFYLGAIQTLIGILGVVGDFLKVGDYTSAAVVMLVSGCLTIVLRVFFTDQPINH